MFIAVDGIDGAGKSTVVRQLAELLGPFDPVTTKEPTDNSEWGKRLREAAINGRLPYDQELEYFKKDRLDHIERVIKPALAQGQIVISDRYVDSTLAFQAQTPAEAQEMYEGFLQEIIVPNVTLILDCTVSIGLERIRKRNGRAMTHFENRDVLERARLIYKSREGENYEHVDASGTMEETLLQAIHALTKRFSHMRDFVDAIRKPVLENCPFLQVTGS